MTETPVRLVQFGGWAISDDEPWYDYYELYEGDTCPDCNTGILVVSKQANLYCSKMCWLDDLTMTKIEGDFE